VLAWARSYPLAVDAALALALLGAALVSSHVNIEDFEAFDPTYRSPSTAGVSVGLAVTIAPLAFRRRSPLATLLACTAGFLVARVALDSIEGSITAIALSVAVFSAAAHGRERWRNRVCRPPSGRRLRGLGHPSGRRWGSVSIEVVLADDQAMLRAGFRLILESEPGISVVGEAEDGEQAVAAAGRLRPDVVLMDIQMPGVDGLKATRRITGSAELATRVVILTTFERDDYVFGALQSGASGFLLKNAPPEELVHAVRVVAQGDALLSPSVTRRIIEQFAARPVRAEVGVRLARLTEREREVLARLASGRSNAELATELYVSEGTIKTHVSSVLTKLGLRDRVQAVVYAYESGLVTPGG